MLAFAFWIGVPVRERRALEDRDLGRIGQAGLLLDDLEDVQAVGQGDHGADAADRCGKDRLLELGRDLVPGDPADVAALGRLGAVRVRLRQRGEIGAGGGGLLLERRGPIGRCRADRVDQDHVPTELAADRGQQVTSLDGRREDRRSEGRIEAGPGVVVGQQPAVGGRAGVLAVGLGDRRELGGEGGRADQRLQLRVGCLGLRLGQGPAGVVRRHRAGRAGLRVAGRVQDVARPDLLAGAGVRAGVDLDLADLALDRGGGRRVGRDLGRERLVNQQRARFGAVGVEAHPGILDPLGVGGINGRGGNRDDRADQVRAVRARDHVGQAVERKLEDGADQVGVLAGTRLPDPADVPAGRGRGIGRELLGDRGEWCAGPELAVGCLGRLLGDRLLGVGGRGAGRGRADRDHQHVARLVDRRVGQDLRVDLLIRDADPGLLGELPLELVVDERIDHAARDVLLGLGQGGVLGVVVGLADPAGGPGRRGAGKPGRSA